MSSTHSKSGESATVQVAVRVRPLNRREDGSNSIVNVKESTIYIKNPETNKNKTFNYDYAYSEESTQEDIHRDIGTYVINNAFSGYNTCVFAYGQSGSGKSWCITGSEEQPGLIPRVCHELFQRQDSHSTAKGKTINYKVEVSYLEIYSENVRDLLSQSPKQGLKVREHPEFGPYIEGLQQILVEDYKTIKKLIDQGNKERMTASTLMNQRSSRSHAILTIYFTQLIDEEYTGKTHEIVSKINLVDLAGSERVELSGVTGINFKEAIDINKSLSTLGLVITKLSEQSHGKNARNLAPAQPVIKPSAKQISLSAKKTGNITPKSSGKNSIHEHVPYRDSVLTWILKESLGGNSKTFMIATISPSEINYNESLSTLRYAANAKEIINTVNVNEDPNDKLIRVLKDEITILKQKLITRGSDSTSSSDDLVRLRDEINQREQLMHEKDKSWSQKLEESKKISDKVEEQLKKELMVKQAEFKQKLETLNSEREILAKEVQSLKTNTTTTDIKELEEEFQKKQAEFEKDRIIGTAVSLQEYYEKKLEKLKEDYEKQNKEREALENTKSLKDISDLKETNIKLKEELNRNQRDLQQHLRQFTNDRLVLSKQIQQLHNKIHTLEQNGYTQKGHPFEPAESRTGGHPFEPVESRTGGHPKRPNAVLWTEPRAAGDWKGLATEPRIMEETPESEISHFEPDSEVHPSSQTNGFEAVANKEIAAQIEIKRIELETLKTEYAALVDKYATDKTEYAALIVKKEQLHNEIDALRVALDTQLIDKTEYAALVDKYTTDKTEYAALVVKYATDKTEYAALVVKKEQLHNEIESLRVALDTQLEYAREKLRNPTIEDLLRIKDGFSKIFIEIQKP